MTTTDTSPTLPQYADLSEVTLSQLDEAAARHNLNPFDLVLAINTAWELVTAAVESGRVSR